MSLSFGSNLPIIMVESPRLAVNKRLPRKIAQEIVVLEFPRFPLPSFHNPNKYKYKINYITRLRLIKIVVEVM